MIVECPTCHGTVEVEDSSAGSVAECPLCRNAFLTPQEASQTQETTAGKTPEGKVSKRSVAKAVASAAWKTTSAGKRRKAKAWGCGCISVLVSLVLVIVVGIGLLAWGVWGAVKEEFTISDTSEEIQRSEQLQSTTDSSRDDHNLVDTQVIQQKPSVGTGTSNETGSPPIVIGEPEKSSEVVVEDNDPHISLDRIGAFFTDIGDRIRKVFVSDDPQSAEGSDKGDSNAIRNLILTGVFCWVVFLILYFTFRGKCPNCKRRRVFKRIGKQVVSRENFFRTVQERKQEHKINKYGQRVPSYEYHSVDRPFTRTTYLVTTRCQACGHETRKTHTEEKRESA
ncbi:MAG: hypothetical protein CMO55_23360 [Verrucomicrobiales bacterium]|nr:hypothetical protein [Verrucomicrobiales bacterium]